MGESSENLHKPLFPNIKMPADIIHLRASVKFYTLTCTNFNILKRELQDTQ